MGDKGGKQHQHRIGKTCCLESCRRVFKYLFFFFKEPRVQGPPAVLSLDNLTPNPDLRLSLLLGSPGSCVGTPTGSAGPV